MTGKTVKSFGNRLRATREMQKMTQADLATRSGLTPSAISQLEGDERDPAFKTLTRLATALGTSVSFLVGEHKPIVPPELRDFFQDLEELDPQDLAKVRDFTGYLRSQSRAKPI